MVTETLVIIMAASMAVRGLAVVMAMATSAVTMVRIGGFSQLLLSINVLTEFLNFVMSYKVTGKPNFEGS